MIRKICIILLAVFSPLSIFGMVDDEWESKQKNIEKAISKHDIYSFNVALKEAKQYWELRRQGKAFNNLDGKAGTLHDSLEAVPGMPDNYPDEVISVVNYLDQEAKKALEKSDDDCEYRKKRYLEKTRIGWRRRIAGLALGSVAFFWGLGALNRIFSEGTPKADPVILAEWVRPVPFLGELSRFTYASGAYVHPILSVPVGMGLVWGSHSLLNRPAPFSKILFEDARKTKAAAQSISMSIADYKKKIENKN